MKFFNPPLFHRTHLAFTFLGTRASLPVKGFSPHSPGIHSNVTFRERPGGPPLEPQRLFTALTWRLYHRARRASLPAKGSSHHSPGVRGLDS